MATVVKMACWIGPLNTNGTGQLNFYSRDHDSAFLKVCNSRIVLSALLASEIPAREIN